MRAPDGSRHTETFALSRAHNTHFHHHKVLITYLMTMKGFIIFLAVCAFTAAMVPMERRAVNTEEEEERLMTQTTTVTTTTEKSAILICAPQTPCAWSVYKPIVKIIEMNIVNSYCKCSSDTSCQVSEEDLEIHSFVLRCKPLNEEGAAAAES